MIFASSVMNPPKPAIYLIYLVLPAILFCSSLSLKKARGPYFIGPDYDPDYAYLLGSLNAANFKNSNLTVHPGTPVQIIGGIALRAHSLINYRDLQKDVLKRPEYYLSRLNGFILAVNVIMLIIIGMAAFFLTGDLLPGLIMQITPFLSGSILNSLTRFNPEPFLFFSSLLLIFVILIKSLKTTKAHEDNWTFILIFALIGGFGLAVKIPFLPLLVIPLFLFKKFSSMLKYTALAAAVFLLFFLPYYHRISYYFGWLWDVARHTGKYGEGKAGIMDLSTLLPNIGKLFRKEPLFIYTLLLSIVFIGVNLAVPRLRKLALKRIVFKALLGILTANIIALTMILKHFAPKYLLAGFSLTGAAIALIYIYMKDLGNELGFSPRPVKFSFIFIFILAGFISYGQLPNLEYILKKRDEKLAIYEKVRQEYKNYKKIFYYGSTSKCFALSFGNQIAAFYHSHLLEPMYGSDVYFYNIYKQAFFNWHKKVYPAEILANPENTIMFGPEITAGRQKLSIIDMTREIFARYNVKLVKPMPGNRGETVFKFEKIKPDAEFKAQRKAEAITVMNSRTLNIAENIDFGSRFRLIKAFTRQDSNPGNIKLHILWECRENRETKNHMLAITLVKNGKNTFGKYPRFCAYSPALEEGELVLTELIIPGDKFKKADFLGIRVNFQRQNRPVSLKVKSNRADQNQSRFLIPIGDTSKRTF